MRRWQAVTSVLAGASAAVRRGDLRTPARRLLSELDIDLTTDTDRLSVPGERGTLLVANHVSWLDIVAALAVEPVGFLAKREMRQWPVLGGVAVRAGTTFIARDELRGLPFVVSDLTSLLLSGRSVLVFPEGTTWCGRCRSADGVPGGAFRRAAFQAAIDASALIRPVTFEYRQGGEPSTVASFVGADTLFTSMRRVARADGLEVRVTAHPAFAPDGDRRELAARARAGVHQVAHV
ncbi:1-acyl-sn-glycerol-3-phosphate acyltransferase [Amycolatopsis acidicola]|uniref:1-acyl-sn-glycerol-3-phosphate acyltransferase n=1 Tax=Amycolatopsis acidicola TaxID=2596893 RepID=A0A5N0VFK6_9PSEU|nr:lysophospholipid acyltransferase family protein [Amycolatopsis acidicola]KAA9164895.1 1-acyl-sn-glycerol-3-phosphate acyltransferase [Amycolatopsis acidicola]